MSKCVVLASGLVVSRRLEKNKAHALVRSRQTCARPRTMAPERPSLSERARDESSFVESACARPRETRASSSSARSRVHSFNRAHLGNGRRGPRVRREERVGGAGGGDAIVRGRVSRARERTERCRDRARDADDGRDTTAVESLLPNEANERLTNDASSCRHVAHVRDVRGGSHGVLRQMDASRARAAIKKTWVSRVASKHSGRVNAATVSPIREPKWTDQTDEEDEDLFSEYFVDGGVTPTPNVEPSAGTAPPGGRTGERSIFACQAPRARDARGLAARSAAKSVRGLTGKVARGIVNALSGRSSVFDFKVFKLFTLVLNATLGTLEIPRQIILIPLIVGSRLSLVPDWLLATFESDSIVDAKASSRREKNKPEVVFPKLRWNALKTWENALQSKRCGTRSWRRKARRTKKHRKFATS